MGLIKLFKRMLQEKAVVEGKATKNKVYSSKNDFSSREITVNEFSMSVEKLFNVNRWSKMPGISSTFQLYTPQGEIKYANKPHVNDFIRILLPGPVPENWVVVTNIKEEESMAEFTVSPSIDPTQKGKEQEEIEHFFINEATSTFRVKLQENTIFAYEIGRNEGINNQSGEAGNRRLLNTLLTEGGWAGFQRLQWKKLTDYLVHKIETD